MADRCDADGPTLANEISDNARTDVRFARPWRPLYREDAMIDLCRNPFRSCQDIFSGVPK